MISLFLIHPAYRLVLNFSHRIDKFGFGTYFPGLKNPLDASLEQTTHRKTRFDGQSLTLLDQSRFQYEISVVPTIYVSLGSFFDGTLLTSQYAVTEYTKEFEDDDQNVVPGLFFRYKLEPISVRITEYRQKFTHFIARLCGIIGGIFVTTGIALEGFRLAKNLVIANVPSQSSKYTHIN